MTLRDRAIKPNDVLHAADAMGRMAKTALAWWGGAETYVDAYEAALRATTDAQLHLARVVESGPMRTMFASCADMTRDIGATQLSTVRWILDV
jgi:hypothetical protein